MMVNCPKCGFEQPEDKYCASCGVDMERYQPKKAPFFNRLVKSLIFQLIALVFLVSIAALFIRSQRSDRAFDVEVPRTAKQNYSIDEEPTDSFPEDERETSSDTEVPSENLIATPSPTPSATPTANAQRQIDLYYQFGEIGLDTLASIRNQGKDEFQGLDSIIGILGTQSEILASGQLRLRSSAPFRNNTAGKEIRFFLGSRAQQEEFREGVQLVITTSLIRESSSLLQIRLVRGFRLGAEPESETEFEVVAEWEAQLPHKGAIYVLGVIPREILESEDTIPEIGNPVFDDIFNSPDFRAGESEFVFMIRSALTGAR